MPYVKRIVCLANSFKIGGYCIAGKEILPNGKIGGWIRPISERPSAEIRPAECQYQGSGSPRLLDIIDIHLLKHEARGHQTENHVIDAHHAWTKIGRFPVESVPQLLDAPPRLWIDSDSTSTGFLNCLSQEEAASQDYSLVLIDPNKPEVEIGLNPFNKRRTYMVDFGYGPSTYRLKLTDPVLISALKNKEEGVYALDDSFLCVSLTEPWNQDNNRCHKLVAGFIPKRRP